MATSQDGSNDDRLTNIEILLSHLQHDVGKLNDALIVQQAQIDDLRRLVSKLESIVETLPEDPRDPGQERPPHY